MTEEASYFETFSSSGEEQLTTARTIDCDVAKPNNREISSKDLINISCLRDVFGLYGFKKDDNVDTREMVLITSEIEKKLKVAKIECIQREDYEAADKICSHLHTLRRDFQKEQSNTEMKRQAYETKCYKEAKLIMNSKVNRNQATHSKLLEEECDERMNRLLYQHQIESNELERQIRDAHRPRVRYSKNLLDMMHSERHMTKLNQFKDAANLKKLVKRIQPKEIAKHEKNIQHKFEIKREKLARRHEFEMNKLSEKLVTAKYKKDRHHALENELLKMKLGNHEYDMQHKHAVTASKNPPQFCAVEHGRVRPVIQNRKNYRQTDSTFRGSQLLASVRGASSIYIPSLCELHSFDTDLPDTHEYCED